MVRTVLQFIVRCVTNIHRLRRKNRNLSINPTTDQKINKHIHPLGSKNSNQPNYQLIHSSIN